MRVLGADIATRSGFAVIEDGKLIYRETYSLREEASHRMRFKDFRSKVLRLLREYKPDAVSFETTYVGVNPKGTAYLNMLRGIFIECSSHRMQLISDTVSKIRKETMGAGKKYTKLDVMEHVIRKYGIALDKADKKSEDIADAILLAEWGYNSLTDTVK